MLRSVETRRRIPLTASLAVPAGLALALTGALPASPVTTAPTVDQADETAYVALGDSFSAGTGTRARTDNCYRSPYGYPALIAGAQGLTLDYQACSGATTADVLANQVGALGPETGLVTMTIGGNDLGFASVITECALPGWLSDCHGAINDGRQILQTQLPGRYDAVLGAIAAGAPSADVRVGGYPHLFNGRDCHLLTFFTRSEMDALNAATDELDALVEQKTTGAGYTYVEPRDAFGGHAVCDRTEWINGLSWPIVESFHPNRAGNIAYADLFAPGSGTAEASAVPAERTAQSESTLVRRQAETVLGMDLTSPANLRAARAAGIPTGTLQSVVRDLESGDTARAAAALERLSELDARHEARLGAHR
ncbi:GDSL-like lipase/acylhydrolase family protein [Ornithinicoccus hortensis]|uniref:GDSL-like lipase/acylhydrolase family protein n=1 Tax=Ornithinicoccus hortensis TaxID=82346 RepID=A0A542YRZ6_9MICO|nr:GDSL-like lipase/acylhydrolase family protein [Ornithinicoccus hortensis]